MRYILMYGWTSLVQHSQQKKIKRNGKKKQNKNKLKTKKQTKHFTMQQNPESFFTPEFLNFGFESRDKFDEQIKTHFILEHSFF